ncbi:type II toxin-antitoxin system PemK/MazF family toxin [Bacillus sp. V5-8f]|uniref:type II toxin-antitoxin system PemK/MazF family toxin n=1 Tax=Bacillus sp. V5-8f TaxID=2053044 RepID=UPI000C7590D7|nr:hypothetical protein CUU64_18715 [Bacillus sp. V5-8f]
MVKHGEIYLVKLQEHVGSEQASTRPCVVIHNNSLIPTASSIALCPISTEKHLWK